MEWSPIQPDASGSSAPWTFQWVCLTCSRTFNVNDVPPMPEATCPGCQQNAGAVVDVATGNVRRVCTSCNRVVTVPDAVEERRDWFSSGPLTRLGPLYGWGSSSPSLPGEGPQSWLFCPLISLGLLQFPRTPQGLLLQCQIRRPSFGHPEHETSSMLSRTIFRHLLATTPWLSHSAARCLGVPQEIIWKLVFRRHSTHSSPHHINVGSVAHFAGWFVCR